MAQLTCPQYNTGKETVVQQSRQSGSSQSGDGLYHSQPCLTPGLGPRAGFGPSANMPGESIASTVSLLLRKRKTSGEYSSHDDARLRRFSKSRKNCSACKKTILLRTVHIPSSNSSSSSSCCRSGFTVVGFSSLLKSSILSSENLKREPFRPHTNVPMMSAIPTAWPVVAWICDVWFCRLDYTGDLGQEGINNKEGRYWIKPFIQNLEKWIRREIMFKLTVLLLTASISQLVVLDDTRPFNVDVRFWGSTFCLEHSSGKEIDVVLLRSCGNTATFEYNIYDAKTLEICEFGCWNCSAEYNVVGNQLSIVGNNTCDEGQGTTPSPVVEFHEKTSFFGTRDSVLGAVFALLGLGIIFITCFYVLRKYRRRQRLERIRNYLGSTVIDPFDNLQSHSELDSGSERLIEITDS
ncbi:hypothetical protein MAR_037178 [Mya arenaria]|uniref:Transmembrane protein n=1 Tax=Mya arenaria TaxID=6604 RepID=A0ABY7FRM7_MYAAR|nr:hypothetical protein MAR_037178 [Mya arenaria]